MSCLSLLSWGAKKIGHRPTRTDTDLFSADPGGIYDAVIRTQIGCLGFYATISDSYALIIRFETI
ncbi:hypothetical protein PITCH_A450011 [uncultured Desulfobacterium sp.]|uniref:Uncharacterized protein n=1 Tax=uncultured Desulfobacterium sp. TaxID=201089 RepID=A0A445N0F9_9BACT|nr:hypothetical protein PITCH_A450011 [uncultured Desulfobacterium sp.]